MPRVGYAQYLQEKKKVYLAGIVVETLHMKMVSNVKCVVGDTCFSSDATGRFGFMAQPGDTIRFQKEGFREVFHVMDDVLLEDEYAVGIFLSRDAVLLDEVVVIERRRSKEEIYSDNAARNLSDVAAHAFFPKEVDAAMSTRMSLEDFASRIANKGHVNVGLGIGTHSISALRDMRLAKKMKQKSRQVSDLEFFLLKELFIGIPRMDIKK